MGTGYHKPRLGQVRRERSKTYLGHDLDLSRLRDVIDDVTIRFAVRYAIDVTNARGKIKETLTPVPATRGGGMGVGVKIPPQ